MPLRFYQPGDDDNTILRKLLENQAQVITGQLTYASTGGSAESAVNIAITDDVATNATMYPVWVTANTGNLPAKVSSTKLSFNPSTGVLSVNSLSSLAGGALSLAALDTNSAINLTPHGTGSINLAATSGGVRLPSTNTAGLQLYNTADQVTNYERLEAVWSGNQGILRVASSGSGTARNLLISATSTLLLGANGNSIYTGVATTSANATKFSFTGVGSNALSGTNIGLSLTPTYNQASGTAANTDLLINRTETAVGSGAQYLIQAQVGGSDRFVFNSAGGAAFSQSLRIGSASPVATRRLFIDGNFSSTAWGTDGRIVSVAAATYTDSSTAASGTAATAVFSSFARPTLAATNTTVTTSDAATVYVAHSPLAGTNQTITRPWSLWVDDGNSRFDGDVQLDTVGTGVIIKSPDGTRWRITVDNAGALVTTSL